MEAHYRFATRRGEEPVYIAAAVLKEIFSETGGAPSGFEDGESGFLIAVAIGEIGANKGTQLPGGEDRGEHPPCRVIESIGESIATGLTARGPGLPSGRLVPFPVAAGGVDVDTDEANIGCADGVTHLIRSACAFGERYVSCLRNEEVGIDSLSSKTAHSLRSYFTRITILEKPAVRTAFAGSVAPMAIVDKYFHNSVLFQGAVCRQESWRGGRR